MSTSKNHSFTSSAEIRKRQMMTVDELEPTTMPKRSLVRAAFVIAGGISVHLCLGSFYIFGNYFFMSKSLFADTYLLYNLLLIKLHQLALQTQVNCLSPPHTHTQRHVLHVHI